MEFKATYRIAHQDGKWGYFCEVTLVVELTPNVAGVRCGFVDTVCQWRDGVRFGIAYAQEKAFGMSPGLVGTQVTVTEVQGHDVDTTEVVAAYVAAHAFWKAVGVNPPRAFELQPGVGLFVFPK